MPVRNGAATVDAALRSISEQTFTDLEVIVIDDGSTDATPALLRKWEGAELAIRIFTQPPLGIVAALQRGLAKVHAPYTARMDADDICHPDRLAAQLDFLERSSELAGCGTGVRLFPSARVTEHAKEYASWLNSLTKWAKVETNLFVECPLAHPTLCFRTEVLKSVGGYRDWGWPEDYDLILRLRRAGHRFITLPRALLNWRISPGRLSRNHPAYSLAAFRSCRVHHLRRSLLADKPGTVIWGAGPTGKKLALEFQRQAVVVLGFVEVDPRKIGQEIHGIKVFATDDPALKKHLADALHIGAVARSKGRANLRRAAFRVLPQGASGFVSMA